jgi:hypothetical protein
VSLQTTFSTRTTHSRHFGPSIISATISRLRHCRRLPTALWVKNAIRGDEVDE